MRSLSQTSRLIISRIFILQGILTCIVAVIGAFTIADFPEKAAKTAKSFAIKFLNQKEAEFVVARIERDRHDAIAEEFSLAKYLKCGLDLKVSTPPDGAT